MRPVVRADGPETAVRSNASQHEGLAPWLDDATSIEVDPFSRTTRRHDVFRSGISPVLDALTHT
jgi:hypothetical protein